MLKCKILQLFSKSLDLDFLIKKEETAIHKVVSKVTANITASILLGNWIKISPFYKRAYEKEVKSMPGSYYIMLKQLTDG